MDYFSNFFAHFFLFGIWFWLVLVVIDGVIGVKDFFGYWVDLRDKNL